MSAWVSHLKKKREGGKREGGGVWIHQRVIQKENKMVRRKWGNGSNEQREKEMGVNVGEGGEEKGGERRGGRGGRGGRREGTGNNLLSWGPPTF
jgi:hypothetical protein